MAYAHVLTNTAAKTGYWDGQSLYADTIRTEQPEANLGCNRVDVIFTRNTPAGFTDDKMQFSMKVAKAAGTNLFTVFPVAELAALETPLDAFVGAILVKMPTTSTCVEYAWFEHRASHGSNPSGGEAVPPAVRRTTKALTGSVASAQIAAQVGTTITWRTAARKHWGRSYLPINSAGLFNMTYGRLSNTSVDDLALAGRTWVNALPALNGQAGVWTWKYQAFLPVTEIKVDDVADIQRRRRAKRVAYAKSYTS